MNEVSRRNLIRGIGAVLMAGSVPAFIPRLVGAGGSIGSGLPDLTDAQAIIRWAAVEGLTRPNPLGYLVEQGAIKSFDGQLMPSDPTVVILNMVLQNDTYYSGTLRH